VVTGAVMVGVVAAAAVVDVMEETVEVEAVTDQDLDPEADGQGQVTDHSTGGIVPETGVTVLHPTTGAEAVRHQGPRADLK